MPTPEDEETKAYWHNVALENMDDDTIEASHVYEDGWYLWSENKRGPFTPVEIKSVRVAGGWKEFGPKTGFVRKGNDPALPRLKIEDAAIKTLPGEEIPFGPWGHLITEDGTVYTLTRQYTHGVVMACLHPDVAEQWGYMPPVAPLWDNNVFHYQKCEHQINDMVNILRVAVGGFAYSFNVSKPRRLPTSDAQVDALRRCALRHGHKLNNLIHTSWGEVTVKTALKYMKER